MVEAYRYKCDRDYKGNPVVLLVRHSVISQTPFGFWISYHNTKKRKRVSNSNGYCHLDKDKAYTHFLSRTTKYIEILSRRLENAKDCLGIASMHRESVIKLEGGHSINRDGYVSPL